MEFDLKELGKKIWDELLQKVKRAVVFVDNESLECLHWNGGVTSLYNSGAADVKEFSSFESSDKKYKKALFITSQPIIRQIPTIIKDIITVSHFEYCVVISAANNKYHLFAHGESDQEEGNRVFQEFEDKVCQWMGNPNYTVEVFSLPFQFAMLTKGFFLTPSFELVHPIQHKDLKQIKVQSTQDGSPTIEKKFVDINFYSLPHEYQIQIKGIVSSFVDLCKFARHGAEVFSIGHTSRLAAIQLSNYLGQEKLPFQSKVSIIFVDRTLDLVGPSGHTSISLLDKVLGTLPELPGHKNNISIDMECLSQLSSHDEEIETVSPGCLMPSDDTTSLFDDLIYQAEDKTVSQVKRKLIEALNDEEIDTQDIDQNVSDANTIENLVSCFKDNPGAILYHYNLLQLGLAVSQTLQSDVFEKWNNLRTLEKILVPSLSLNEEIVTQICKLVEKQIDNENQQISIEDLLEIILFSFALQDQFQMNSTEKSTLMALVKSILMECQIDELPNFLLELLNPVDEESCDLLTDEQADSLTQNIMNALGELCPTRNDLKIFNSVCIDDGVMPPYYNPIICQITEAVLNPNKPLLEPDIEHISSGLKDFLKMGFSMFKKVSKPHPADNQNIIIYVIGGVTADEVRKVQNINNKYKNLHSSTPNIIIGSNRILSPEDTINSTLFTENLN